MNVLLINPQLDWRSDSGLRVLRDRTYNDHLGIRYIAAFLEQYNHHVDLIDAHFERITKDGIFQAINKKGYDYYGISVVEPIIPDSIEIARYIKRIHPNKLVFIGGYSATLLGDEILRCEKSIDGAVIGEGEHTTRELLDVLYQKEKWRQVAGLYYRENEEIIHTKARALICDLDSLPFPKRGEKELYNGKANILSSRGCYGRCNFCSISSYYDQMIGKRIRVRAPEKVVDEMEKLHRELNVNHFDFVDDNFAINALKYSDWTQTFCEEIQKRNLKITFGIQARANDVHEETMKMLFSVGLRVVSIGIENDVVRAAKLMNTGTTKAIHREAVTILKRTQMQWWVEMIIMEPTATLDEIRENLGFLEEIEITENFRQNPVTFYPRLKLYSGTRMLELLQNEIVIKKEGFAHKYIFKEKSVQKLNELIDIWQRKTVDIVNLFNSYLHYEASALGMIAHSISIVKLSRQYLRFDLQFFREVIDFVEENPSFDEEKSSQFLVKYNEKLEYFYNAFNKYRMLIYGEI